MRIGYFVTHYPYEIDYGDYFCGGTGTVAKNLGKEMIRRGHNVSIFTTSRTKNQEFGTTDEIEIYRFGKNFRIGDAYISFKLLFGPLIYKMDIIHTHMGNAPAPIAAYIYSKLKNIPLIVTYHGDQQDSYGNFIRRYSVKIFNKIFVKSILGAADMIISPSEPFINESKFLPNFRDKITVIPNAVNLNDVAIDKTKEDCKKDLGIPKDNIVILFVGSLSKYKGPDILLESVNIAVQKIPNMILVFVGNGQMKNELKLIVEKLGLRDNVIFAGFVDNQTRNKYFKIADIFVLPSILNTELFPIVLLEASSARLPIIVSNLETFKCIIHNGINGLVTKRNDWNDLANALILLSTDKKLRDKISGNAYLNVKNFSWNRVANETEKLYGDILCKSV